MKSVRFKTIISIQGGRKISCKSNAFTISIVAILLLVGSIAGWAAPIRDGDPLTIGAILTQEDGSTATVTAEQIVSTGRSGKSYIIKEWFEKQATPPRLIVVSKQQLPVESGWTCDITGVLSTVSGVSKDGRTIRQRVLITLPESVSIYMSPNGQHPIPFLPIKGFEANWASKVSLADFAGASMAAGMSAMDGGELPPIPDDLESEPAPPAPGSRDSLKWLPDGAPVSVNGAVVSASFSDYGFFYVEKSDRSFGIWISAPDYVYEGQLLDITGRMGTGGGERTVIADQGGVAVLDYYNTYPRPTEVGLTNKTLGGGAVGLYTPAIADAVGLNTTGLLTRVWGKVTAVDSQYPIYWIDDGSNVAAAAGHTGVKVYDVTYDPLPSVNDYVTLSGVSASEWPQGSTSNIRVVWKTAPVARSTQPGSGTISGTITATGANGKTVKVYCVSASTTATFTGDTANYTLNVPYGDHAVTASMLGYKTTTQLATVSSGTPVGRNFTLSALERRIDVVPLQKRIAPDGVSQTMVLAIVRDEEGRRLSGGTITWTTTDGNITPETSSVDDVGEAVATLTSSTDHTTSTVWAEMDGVSGGCYVEFANEGDPSIRITDPVGGQVSGFIPVRVDAYDADSDGVLRMQLYVDGEPKGSIVTNEYRLSGLDTSQLSNGWHTLTAKATDDNLNVMRSQEVYIYADNEVSQVDYSSEIFTDEAVPGNIVLSAQLNTTGAWSIEIRNYKNNSLAYSTSGTGPGPIQATWDGKIGGSYTSGFYKVIFSTESSGGQYITQQSTTREYIVTISECRVV